MVEVECRRVIADAIDRYLHDLIDNFELDDVLNAQSNNDLACREIAREMSRFIDDFKRHHYSDLKLSPNYERGVERWVAFLRTFREWPLSPRPRATFLKAVLSIFQRKESTPFTRNPYWPYANETEWTAVLQHVCD